LEAVFSNFNSFFVVVKDCPKLAEPVPEPGQPDCQEPEPAGGGGQALQAGHRHALRLYSGQHFLDRELKGTVSRDRLKIFLTNLKNFALLRDAAGFYIF
jgi:hypothetical protein